MKSSDAINEHKPGKDSDKQSGNAAATDCSSNLLADSQTKPCTSDKSSYAASDIKQFFDKNFDAIDPLATGSVSKAQIDSAITSGKYTGSDAAVLQTVSDYFDRISSSGFFSTSAISRSDISRLDEELRNNPNSRLAQDVSLSMDKGKVNTLDQARKLLENMLHEKTARVIESHGGGQDPHVYLTQEELKAKAAQADTSEADRKLLSMITEASNYDLLKQLYPYSTPMKDGETRDTNRGIDSTTLDALKKMLHPQDATDPYTSAKNTVNLAAGFYSAMVPAFTLIPMPLADAVVTPVVFGAAYGVSDVVQRMVYGSATNYYDQKRAALGKDFRMSK